ncbi:MAG: hypothetical protein Q7S02_03365 [bacterium]|nr:hypothetical protein [bacterium]
MFVIVDGIDGSGKGTIANALAAARRAEGARVFDLREFAKSEHRLPEPEELEGYDVLISAEPTHTWVGQTIRDEIIRDNGRNYGALRTAEAFALDRLILYRRILLPARRMGLDIIQERSVTSSLVYQPIQQEPVALEQLLALEGNAFTLEHPPELCVIVSTDPTRAIQRLQLRTTKQDVAIFEKLPILQQLHERYHAPWFRELLDARGWHVEYLDANGAVEDAVAHARKLWDTNVRVESPVRP